MGGAVGGAAGLLRLPLDPPERVQQQAARAPQRAMLAPSVPAAPGTCWGMPSDAQHATPVLRADTSLPMVGGGTATCAHGRAHKCGFNVNGKACGKAHAAVDHHKYA